MRVFVFVLWRFWSFNKVACVSTKRSESLTYSTPSNGNNINRLARRANTMTQTLRPTRIDLAYNQTQRSTFVYNRSTRHPQPPAPPSRRVHMPRTTNLRATATLHRRRYREGSTSRSLFACQQAGFFREFGFVLDSDVSARTYKGTWLFLRLFPRYDGADVGWHWTD
jgi:hypothetical protein